MMPQPKKTWLLTSLCFTLLYGVLLHGTATCREVHPFSQVTGTFYVSKSRVSARLTIFVEDLYLFHEMEPDDEDRPIPPILNPLEWRTSNFFLIE